MGITELRWSKTQTSIHRGLTQFRFADLCDRKATPEWGGE